MDCFLQAIINFKWNAMRQIILSSFVFQMTHSFLRRSPIVFHSVLKLTRWFTHPVTDWLTLINKNWNVTEQNFSKLTYHLDARCAVSQGTINMSNKLVILKSTVGAENNWMLVKCQHHARVPLYQPPFVGDFTVNQKQSSKGWSNTRLNRIILADCKRHSIWLSSTS